MAGDVPRPMGRLGSVYGIKGYIKVQSFTERPENLFDYSPWFIRRRGEDWREVQVTAWQPYQQGFIAKLDGVDTREQALLYTGMDIGIKRSSLPPPSEGEFYLTDLEGCQVIGLNGVCLGTVSRIMDHGAAPLLVVSPSDLEKDGPKERLIPFVMGPIVSAVDLSARVIRVEWGADY